MYEKIGEKSMLNFTTKAETLKNLEPLLVKGKVLPLIYFTVRDWKENTKELMDKIEKMGFFDKTVIVRSSAKNEDTEYCSNAGKFLSIADVKGKEEVKKAILEVANEMGEEGANQIFIQPYLQPIEMCGVIFTMDPNTGGNYYVFNYDDVTGSTSSVTDGSGEHLKMLYHFKGEEPTDAKLKTMVDCCKEIEHIFQHNCLDIEFAWSEGQLYILQVRPLILKKNQAKMEEQEVYLNDAKKKFRSSKIKHPDLFGKETVYGVMPDWNPAEMIGIRPRQLAASLYREIITNGVWAYQRDNYGYQNLRSFPLMIDFCGLPYIDTRVSFNSFLPKGIPTELGEKLIDYYINKLKENPKWHDKIEFQIAFTCYTFDLDKRIEELYDNGFTKEEVQTLMDLLREMTNHIIHPSTGLWKKDANKIHILKKKHKEIMESKLEIQDKIYWLLEYCKRYGTLPFAGLARAGFIAVEFLRSFVTTGILSEEEKSIYMNSLSTIGKLIATDFSKLSKKEFLKQYGHLRPGTYDICSKRYDQGFEQYFSSKFEQEELYESLSSQKKEKNVEFRLSLEQFSKLQGLLQQHGLQIEVLDLFDFMKQAIEGREYAKFIFTHILSDVLELLVELGKEYNFSREDLSYLNIRVILDGYTSSFGLKDTMERSIAYGKQCASITDSFVLPPIIWNEEQFTSFFMPDGEPNYITQKECEAQVVVLPSEEDLAGKIVMIKGADPGFDWIFSKGIVGFITAYGGANSHMAIRSAEFGIPAVIGVGEKAFEQYAKCKTLRIDCLNRKVEVRELQ